MEKFRLKKSWLLSGMSKKGHRPAFFSQKDSWPRLQMRLIKLLSQLFSGKKVTTPFLIFLYSISNDRFLKNIDLRTSTFRTNVCCRSSKGVIILKLRTWKQDTIKLFWIDTFITNIKNSPRSWPTNEWISFSFPMPK